MDQHCGLCAGELGTEAVRVCAACQRRHAGSSPVRATGEFMAVAPPPDVEPVSGPAIAIPGCTWCGKSAGSVRKLLGNGAVAICDECVALCADVMDAELGDGWRPERS